MKKITFDYYTEIPYLRGFGVFTEKLEHPKVGITARTFGINIWKWKLRVCIKSNK